MFKSKLSIFIIFFLFAAVLIAITTVFLSTKAKQRIAEGSLFLLEGELTQALESYKEAQKLQKLWPISLYDSEINSWIERMEKAEAAQENQPVNIFMKKNATDSEIQSLIREVRTLDGVKEVKYISKEVAFNQYKEQNKDDPELVKLVSPGLLPASILIWVDNPSLKDEIINLAKTKPFVEYAN